MEDLTRRTLNALNRRFYRERGDEFAARRTRPWRGWERLMPRWREISAAVAAPAVLDVGCGNGRFGRFLARRLPVSWRYLGLDASPVLLARARRDPPVPGCRLLRLDLVEDSLAAALGEERFHLVALYGILHHLPGEDLRHRLLGELAQRLLPGGLLALSLWRFGAPEQLTRRYRRRLMPWSELPPDLAAGVAAREVDLEPGDFLLRWGDGGSAALRYCHFTDEAEEGRLLAALTPKMVLPPLERFEADGREGGLNRYLVLRRAEVPRPPP